MTVYARELVAPWRALRRAVREAHALGIEFHICGDRVRVDGIERLPNKLREALDPDLLWAYTGADEDDEEAIAFLEALGVEAALVSNARDAAAAIAELEAQKSPVIGLDIETASKPKFAQPRPPILINQDGGIRKPKALDKKAPRPPAIDPHRAEIATLQLFAGGTRCFVFLDAALDWVLASAWFTSQTFIAHNAAFESAFLQHRGVHVNIGCTLQAGGLVIGVGFGGERRALDSVSTEVLGLTPPKALQVSDWSAPQLSPGQICYAASDAILARLRPFDPAFCDFRRASD
jgi:hypothetical protein